MISVNVNGAITEELIKIQTPESMEKMLEEIERLPFKERIKAWGIAIEFFMGKVKK